MYKHLVACYKLQDQGAPYIRVAEERRTAHCHHGLSRRAAPASRSRIGLDRSSAHCASPSLRGAWCSSHSPHGLVRATRRTLSGSLSASVSTGTGSADSDGGHGAVAPRLLRCVVAGGRPVCGVGAVEGGGTALRIALDSPIDSEAPTMATSMGQIPRATRSATNCQGADTPVPVPIPVPDLLKSGTHPAGTVVVVGHAGTPSSLR